MAAATRQAGCDEAGGWCQRGGGWLQRLQSVAANEVLLVAASGKDEAGGVRHDGGVEIKIMI